MPIPRVRFTVRRMMIAVAIIAVAVGGLILWRRAMEYRQRAVFHSWERKAGAATSAVGPAPTETVRINRAREAYHDTLFHKYDRAARYPFLPVAPDPPEPE